MREPTGRNVVSARVIPWDGQCGAAFQFEGGRHFALPIGTREQAEQFIERCQNEDDFFVERQAKHLSELGH